jgi:diguanylate cyclase (GGDEF)-like protein
MSMRSRLSKTMIGSMACLVFLFAAAISLLYNSRLSGNRLCFMLALFYAPMGTLGVWALIRFIDALRARERALITRLEAERSFAKQMCLAAIETLTYAVEAKTPQNTGHLGRVQAYTVAIARALGIDEDSLDGLRVAALLHDIGQLGVPTTILHKTGALTEEEREKMRAYPVLGGRILSAIPFPWPVVPMVRHHRENFDGTGYPDGLFGEQIPLGARILAVADTYESLVRGLAHRSRCTHAEAIEQIQAAAGTMFDPQVVTAFLSVVDSVNQELERADVWQDGRSAAAEIARAHRDMLALYELACSVGSTLCLSDTLDVLIHKIRAIVNCSTCVIYLLEEDREYLRARGVYGQNHWHFRRSRARVGTFLTGRVVSRGQPILTSFMTDDILLHPTAEPWVPLRSTLIVPLVAQKEVIGTINLYHTEPNAFQADDLRVMSLVGEMAGRAVHNACLFTQTQETAFTDPLTGLRNARYLRQFLEQEVNRARKNNHNLAVLGLDLDRFKPVNDTYGHARGDRVLCEIGKILQSQVRNYDLVARYAGDEFVVVLPEAGRQEAELVATKIKRAIERYAESLVVADAQFPRIGVSIGIAIFPVDAGDLRGLLTFADHGMYEDKRASRAA